MESWVGLTSLVVASTRQLNLLIPAGLAVRSAGELAGRLRILAVALTEGLKLSNLTR